MDPARLELSDASGPPRSVVIDQHPFRIGRSKSNELALPEHTEVSRHHAEIHWDGSQYFLRDCGSKAGTYLNDVPVTADAPLASGDRIGLGPRLAVSFVLESSSTDAGDVSGSSTAISDLRQAATLLARLRALGDARVLDHVLDLVVDSAIEVAHAERGFIMLVNQDGELEYRRGRGKDGVSLSGDHFETSRRIPQEVFESGRTQLVRDLRDANVAAQHDDTIALGIRNVLCAPLRAVHIVDAGDAARDDVQIGVLYLDSHERQSFHASGMQAVLETLAKEAAVAIENARLYRAAQENAQLEQDLRMAQAFQQALLPTEAPALGYFDAAASMIPCRMIGGDFYEYIDLPGGMLGFTLGDVAGKGAPAGLLGARVQEVFAAQAPAIVDPAASVTAINTVLLRRSLESRFVTMVYGVLSADGQLRYCNAGHNHPVLVTRSGVRRLGTGGTIVGLFTDAQYDEATIQLAPGDLLVIFSDGISEATNVDGEEFGERRIVDCVTTPGHEPAVVLARLFDELRQFIADEHPMDDMTALVLRYRGP